MKVLDEQLDNNPTTDCVKEIVELRIQNLLCLRELKNFNDCREWLYRHPIIKHLSERSILEQLKKENPAEFLKQYEACKSNIKRYRSYIKNKDRKDRHDKDKQLLKRHTERETLFISILAQ